ncbi:carboxyltransferase subunit alpha [Frankia sp. CiP1_Cm_nod2]|uniref:carboxyltransferase subunit alpha n=1 Tax=Frankia sp. CiP1_Cm_nod2 TaxID=2897161 RepID=UPI002024D3E7
MSPAATTPATTEWVRCRACSALVYGKRFARNLFVCPECGDHGRVGARQRIGHLLDPDSFTPLELTPTGYDPLDFSDGRRYEERWHEARRRTGLPEAVLCGTGRIGGRELAVAVMDFSFMGGSLGSAAGEMITLTAELARERRLPFVVVTTSGGARMQEGALSLMQMAKTSIAVGQLRRDGLLTVSVVTDPTYGGVAASFATNTDVVLAEAGARLGFAGPRVVRQTTGERLPDGFQGSAFLAARGHADLVVQRAELRPCLSRLLAVAAPGRRPTKTRPAIREARPPAPRQEHDPVAAGAAARVLIRDPRQLRDRDPWERVRLARDLGRPTTLDLAARVFDSFLELRGDRTHGDSPAIVAGLAEIGGVPVAVVGHQKGHTTAELLSRDFGLAKPEGYRKALRIMELAERLGLPVVTLVDTPGAHPGVEAEERGQASVIANAIQRMSALRVPVVSVVTGEGGSGGALALAVADQVLIVENGVYTVISPEGCSAILWNNSARAPDAARSLGLDPRTLLRAGIVDAVVPEPPGGTQADPGTAADTLRAAVLEALLPLLAVPPDELVARRAARFRGFGAEAVDVPARTGRRQEQEYAQVPA